MTDTAPENVTMTAPLNDPSVVCKECGKPYEQHEPSGRMEQLTVSTDVDCWGLKSRFERFISVDNYGEKLINTNPNGANQYEMDPRQRYCWKLYITPGGKTFGNAYQSAILAGYEEWTARTITSRTWFREKVRRLNLLGKAEQVLEEMLDMPVTVLDLPRVEEQYPHTPEDEDYDADDETAWNERRDQRRANYIVTDPSLVKIKQDTAKFVAERQGKDEGWSSRSEVTGKGGRDLIPVDPAAKERSDKAIAEFLAGGANLMPDLPDEQTQA